MKNTNKNILIGILSVIIVILIVIIIFVVAETINHNKQDLNEDFRKIITEELTILTGKKNLQELTNQDKLWFAYEKSTANDKEKFNAQILSDYFKNSSLGNLGLTFEDIGFLGTDCSSYEEEAKKHCVEYYYNNADNTYSKNELFVSWNPITPIIKYSKIDDYIKKEDKYIVKAKYLFSNMPGLLTIYGNYNDAINDTNSIASSTDFTEEKAKTYLQDSKVATYNYVFTVKDEQIKLVDFYVE